METTPEERIPVENILGEKAGIDPSWDNQPRGLGDKPERFWPASSSRDSETPVGNLERDKRIETVHQHVRKRFFEAHPPAAEHDISMDDNERPVAERILNSNIHGELVRNTKLRIFGP